MFKQKVAVAIVHGIGRQAPDFADALTAKLQRIWRKRLMRDGYDPCRIPIVVKPVYWAEIVEEVEERLWKKYTEFPLKWKDLRRFVIGYLGDAIVYQRPAQRNDFVYDQIHQRFKMTLRLLAEECGGSAPLNVIANSLGTVISCEVMKELQHARPNPHVSPLEQGKTLTNLYSTGSPLPIWSLREENYGKPPQVPAPDLAARYPGLNGEWLNFYSNYDVLSYPLKPINKHYFQQVTKDVKVSVGHLMIRYTPLSHGHYASNRRVVRTIADSIYDTWKQLSS